MSKDTRKKLMLIRYSDLAAICEQFEQMEAEGWRLESLGLLAEYRRCEPRKVRYSAELLDTASPLAISSPEISDGSLDYIDLCEQTGWSLVSHYGLLHIFRTEDINAPEIVTDPVENLHTIKRSTIRTYLLMWIGGVLLISALIFMFAVTKSPAIIATDYNILFYSIMGIIAISIIGELSFYFLFWYMKAKRAVSESLPIPFNDTKAVNRATMRDRILIFVLMTTPFLLFVPDALRGDLAALGSFMKCFFWFAVFFTTTYFVQVGYRSTAKTIIATVVFAFSLTILMIVTVISTLNITLIRYPGPAAEIITDARGNFVPDPYDIPVTLSDVNPAAEKCTNWTHGKSSIIAGLYTYTSKSTDPDMDQGYLQYKIYHSHFEWLLQSYVRDLGTNDPNIEYVREEIEATLWGAQKAYIASDDRVGLTAWILVYDENVLVIDTLDKNPGAAVIDKYAEVFGEFLGAEN